MKTTSLSLSGTTGTIAPNRDNTHESSVIHIKPTDKVASGQVSLFMPLKDSEGNDIGLEPGEYNISVSMVRAFNQPSDGSGPLVTKESLAATAPATDRRKSTT